MFHGVEHSLVLFYGPISSGPIPAFPLVILNDVFCSRGILIRIVICPGFGDRSFFGSVTVAYAVFDGIIDPVMNLFCSFVF